MPQDEETKLQCTLTGYQAWVFQQLQARRGLKKHDIARRAWEEWLENHEHQLTGWGLSPDEWARQMGGKVANIENQRRRRRLTKISSGTDKQEGQEHDGGG